MPSSTPLREAIRALRGHALDSEVENALGFRVARVDGAIYLDLGGRDWRAAKVTSEGWTIVRNPGMYRPVGLHALPPPVSAPGRGVADLASAGECR
jgi:hypothetical protein